MGHRLRDGPHRHKRRDPIGGLHTPYLILVSTRIQQQALARLWRCSRSACKQAGLTLRLGVGADTHLVPDILISLRSGRIPTLNGSRYFLLEPPHHVAPPRLSETCFALLTAGYIPIITHPERLSWVEDHYALFQELAGRGVWMQVTAGSLTGRFGHKARYWAEHMLDEGIVHLLATDAHGVRRRPPLLAEGRQAAERWVGPQEAMRLVEDRPQAVVDDLDPSRLPIPPGLSCNSGSHLS